MQIRDTTNAHSLPLLIPFLCLLFFTSCLPMGLLCLHPLVWRSLMRHYIPPSACVFWVSCVDPLITLTLSFLGGGAAIINASEPGIRGCLTLSTSSCFNRSHKCPWKEYSHQPWNEIFGKREIPKPSHKTLDSLYAMQVISIILTQYLKNKMVVHHDNTKPRNNCLTKKFYMLPYAQHITHTQ